jgi:hypothetical protein
MPIQVTCPGCHTRFRVSDHFAGKTGPCPKCKATIRVPDKSDEVIIHAPEEYGPTSAEGKPVLKPIERRETRVSPVAVVAIVGSVVLVLVVAFLLRPTLESVTLRDRALVLGLGAVALAPPLVWAGYSFLRDAELEPYRGMALALRVAICALVYAALWGVYAYFAWNLLGARSPEIWHLAFALPALVGAGAVAPLASLDLDYTSACFHYGLYLFVTIMLRLVMGLPPL